MKVYVPFWFIVKQNPQAIHGSRHLYKYIQMTRSLPQNIQKIIKPRIQTNGFYCHPENILLSMITDENRDNREKGYAKKFEARANPSLNVRPFAVPTINFECDSNMTMINWDAVRRLTEPPCIQFIPHEVLLAYANSENRYKNFYKYSFLIFSIQEQIFHFRFPMPFAKYGTFCKNCE